jgi:hypothetical protein
MKTGFANSANLAYNARGGYTDRPDLP